MAVETKRCPRHFGGRGAVLPASQFHKNASNPDGLNTRCKSCHNEQRRLHYARFGSSLVDLFCGLRGRATRMGVDFNITLKDFERLISEPCVYGGGKRPQFSVGLDRKSPGGDYVLSNVVPCCPRHNSMKQDLFTFESMKRIVAEFPEARSYGNLPKKAPRKSRSVS